MIYIKNADPTNLNTLLKSMFHLNKNGLDGNNMLKNTDSSYSDPEFLINQCLANRYRSFDDIVEFVNTYLPEVSVKEILEELIDLYRDKNIYLYVINCYNIQKPTMCYTSLKLDHDIYSDDFRAENSKYNWINLFAMIGITDNIKKKIRIGY